MENMVDQLLEIEAEPSRSYNDAGCIEYRNQCDRDCVACYHWTER